MTTITTPNPSATGSRRRNLRNATVGNVLEWYDWNVYAIFTPFFAPRVFSSHDSAGALLQSMTVFAVGFLTRPVGGLLLGRWGDRFGRRAALTLSMVLMAAGSLLIAACPPYSAVGWLAPAIVLVARLAQGLSAGGEFAAASAYAVEIAPAHRRGLYSSAIYVSNALGNLLAALLGVALTRVLSAGQMESWGWRLPFLVGAGLAGYAFVLRGRMDESARGAGEGGAVPGVREALLRRPAAALRVVGYTLAGTVVYYTWVVFLPSAATAGGHVTAPAALVATTVAQVVFIVALPLTGLLADRIGIRPLLVGFAAAFALLTVPLLALAPTSSWWLLVCQCGGLIVFCGYGATAPLLMARQFPADARVTGIGLPYGVAVSVFGGTAPYLAAACGTFGHPGLYGGYVGVACVTSLVMFTRIPSTRDRAAGGRLPPPARGAAPEGDLR